MARDSIAENEVLAAMKELLAEGQRVSARNVRVRLGGGSMSTITRMMRAIQERTPAAAEPEVDLPTPMLLSLKRAITEAVQTAEASLRMEICDLSQNLADVVAEAERTANALKDAEEANLELRRECADLKARLDEAKRSQVEEAERARLTVDGLNETHKTERDALLYDLNREREALEQARTDVAMLRLQMENLPKLEVEVVELRNDARSLLERAARAETAHAAAAASLKAVDDDLMRDRADLARAREEVRQLQKEVADLRVHVQVSQVALDSSAREITLLRESRRPAHAPTGKRTPAKKPSGAQE